MSSHNKLKIWGKA